VGLCRLDAVHRGPVSRPRRSCGPKPPKTVRPTSGRARRDLCVLAGFAPLFSTSGTTPRWPRNFWAPLPCPNSRPNRRAFYAATRALEIISEAARRLSPAVRERHPDLPWRAIMGVGNVLRHNYDDVAEEQVWRTVLEDLPALDRAIAAEIE